MSERAYEGNPWRTVKARHDGALPGNGDRKTFDYWRTGLREGLAVREAVEPLIEHSLRHSKTNSEGKDWDGGIGWDGFAAMVRDGDPQASKRLAKLEAAAVAACPVITGKAPKVGLAIAGGSVSVGAYLGGSPVCMRKRRRVTQRFGKSVRVGINVSASSSVGAKELRNQALVAMAIVRAAESRGVQVELDVIMAAKSHVDRLAVLAVNVKRAGAYIDRSRFAAMAHPALFRRFGFALWEAHPEWAAAWGSGYGRPFSAHGDLWSRELGGYHLLLPGLQFWGPGSVEVRDGADPEYRGRGVNWSVDDQALAEFAGRAVREVLPRLGVRA